uniref:PAX-interacting protein 1 n=1 Tax=Cajanus cajan TaxID=3821 RepID=A0A151T715_CAJCA|nr:PAX-interacting protein 1 [Cajanus cajan]
MSGEEDDDNECRYFEDTVPNDDNECQYFEDTVPFDEDVLETEVEDLAGETQKLDDIDTQLLEEELESDRTQVLENVNDEVSADETQCVDSDNGQTLDSKKGESSQQNSSGSMPPRFTVLRAESLRQAALANRNMNLKQTQDKTISVMGIKDFLDQENEHGKYTLEFGVLKNKSMCKVANSAVRKLFNDELPIETDGPSLSSNDFNEGDGLDKLPTRGLSYINSQEPGLLSQDNALNFVDRFLKDNIMEFDQETNCVKKIKERSKSILTTKGKQSLVKRVNDRDKAGRTGIYDWDDSCEDEGGGDIYLRRKDDFFKGETHGPRSLPVFQKSKVSRLNNDKKGHSDSRLGMHVLKVKDNIMQEPTLNLKRNLANELDEQFDTDCSGGEKEPNANAGAQEISGLTYKLNNPSTGKMRSVSSKGHSGQYDRKKRVDVKSKLQTSGLSKKSIEVVRQCKKDNMMAKSKMNKLNAEGNQISSADENDGNNGEGLSNHFEVDDNSNSCQFENSALKASAVSVSDDVEMGALDCPKRSLRIRKFSDESPRERDKSSDSASATPAKCKMPVNDASPVCMGDEYYKQSCNRNLSRSCLLKASRKELHRELQSLSTIKPELLTPSKDSRKRRDMTDVRILYSHHLDEDIIKHQKKILARLGVSVASSIADATHFIADQFVRTRNLLEAIASGKPVVTHLWIESCGQASCFIDERNYILRDAKKEKEIGFSMPVSLARAIQHPLLEGRRVLITPNTKPSKEIVSNLARAVQGQVVEKVGRSFWKGDKIADDLLIISCEEDYASCVPFLEKGATVYSSELLLNGIVTQKLEYQRHRLFADNVKKTRSTLWLKRDDKTFVPVTKCN